MSFLVLLTVFVVVPIAEISLLIKVGGSIGVANTIVFVIATAALGAYLVRQQGFATLTKLQQEASAGRMPAMQIAEGVALLFAGAVLLTPGFITDAIGFALLTPFLRRFIIGWAVKQATNKMHPTQRGFHTHNDDEAQPYSRTGNPHGQIIEGKVINKSKSDK